MCLWCWLLPVQGVPFSHQWVTFRLGQGDSLGSLHPVSEVELLLEEAAGTGELLGRAGGRGALGSFILLVPSPWDTSQGSCATRPAQGSCRMQFCINAGFGVLGQLQNHSGFSTHSRIQACCRQCRAVLQLGKCQY